MLKKLNAIWIFFLFSILTCIIPPKIIALEQDYVENQTPQQNQDQTNTEDISFDDLIKLLRILLNSDTASDLNVTPQKSADFPIQLVNQIKNACVYDSRPGVVKKSNISCLDNVNISTRDVLKESANTHENLQCVGFVRAVVIATTGLDVCEAAGSANECKDNNTYYEFVYTNSGRQIQPGDLPIWSFLKYGHIAYVTKVNGSKYFDVAEANFTNGGKLLNGSVQIRHATTDEPEFAGWLTKKI